MPPSFHSPAFCTPRWDAIAAFFPSRSRASATCHPVCWSPPTHSSIGGGVPARPYTHSHELRYACRTHVVLSARPTLDVCRLSTPGAPPDQPLSRPDILVPGDSLHRPIFSPTFADETDGPASFRFVRCFFS